MTRDFYLTKKGTDNRVMFPATELENGMLIGTNRLPMVIGDELKAAGFTTSDLSTDVDSLPEALTEIVLRVGDNRGHLVERRETPTERSAREKAERDEQNAFLKEKGYHWEKRSFYVSGEIGDMVTRWFLIDPDGEAVIGARDGGGRIEEYGYLKGLLLQLGFYGEEAKAEAEAEKTRQLQERKVRSDARKRIDEFFENSDSVREASPRVNSIHIDSTRTNYRIVPEVAIYRRIYNGMDGDDWSHNNDGMYISSRFPFDAQIAEDIQSLQK